MGCWRAKCSTTPSCPLQTQVISKEALVYLPPPPPPAPTRPPACIGFEARTPALCCCSPTGSAGAVPASASPSHMQRTLLPQGSRPSVARHCPKGDWRVGQGVLCDNFQSAGLRCVPPKPPPNGQPPPPPPTAIPDRQGRPLTFRPLGAAQTPPARRPLCGPRASLFLQHRRQVLVPLDALLLALPRHKGGDLVPLVFLLVVLQLLQRVLQLLLLRL